MAAPPSPPFTGSYSEDQAIFLLTPVSIATTPVEEKERRIQSGERHYSEMLTLETAPPPEYVALFRALTARYKRRLASELNALAEALMASHDGELTLVSLARAGTPVGALLQRAIALGGGRAKHYSISILLGRGPDEAALRHLLETERRDPRSLRFVDGWTAKGTIGGELRRGIARWNALTKGGVSASLNVVMDLGGTAARAATLDDYAIPCGLLNATVSGLVSRSVLPPGHDRSAFHGCVYHSELAPADLTQWFHSEVANELSTAPAAPRPTLDEVAHRRAATRRCLHDLQLRYGADDASRIKPGVAEATRAVLRRLPDRILVRDAALEDVAHLLLLARRRDLPVTVDPRLPFNAVTLVRKTHA